MDSIGSLAVIFLCLVLQGMFSGGELALVSSDLNRLRSRAKKGDQAAARAILLLENPEWFLAATLTGTNICVIVSTVTATAFSIDRFGAGQGELLAVLVMVPTLLIFGEMIPKSVFHKYRDTLAPRISLLISLASYVLYPVVYLVARISRGTMRIARKENDLTSSYITKDGLRHLLNNQGPSDILEAEREMVQRILDFSGITTKRIMVPLSAMTSIGQRATLDEAAGLFGEKNFMRIPVYGKRLDDIIGIINYFDILTALRKPVNTPVPQEAIDKYLRKEIIYAPENKPAKDLFVEMNEKNDKMAVVVDEYGGAVGIVTLEDILTEIVGNIEDKNQKFKRLAPGRYLIQAGISLEAANQLLPVVLPAGNYETLGGFILWTMGKIPRPKETFYYDQLRFVIEDADVKSVREILVIYPPEMDRLNANREVSAI